jgi:hypothetical protein
LCSPVVVVAGESTAADDDDVEVEEEEEDEDEDEEAGTGFAAAAAADPPNFATDCPNLLSLKPGK